MSHFKIIFEWKGGGFHHASSQDGIEVTTSIEVTGILDPITVGAKMLISKREWHAIEAAVEGREDVEVRRTL